MKWIPVAERLPTADVACCLIAYEQHKPGVTTRGIDLVNRHNGKFINWRLADRRWSAIEVVGVTHWMPLPEYPDALL